jgi:hypothetical protein
MSTSEIPFNIGYKIGEMTRQIELSMEFVKNPTRQRPILKLDQIYESLKYILLELELLNIPKDILKDITEYLDSVSGGRYSEEQSEEEEKSDEMLLGKIKKSITKRTQNLTREMKIDEMKTLLHKLQIWRDRISNSFARM